MKVSNSRIQCYKSCRRMYQLKYLYGLTPVQTAEVLERGASYHDKVEEILRTGELELGLWDDDFNPKVSAMASAFNRWIYPSIMLEVEAEEEWFSYKTKSGNEVIGRIDARLLDGTLVEHKTTSGEINEAYWYGLENNEQILTYMAAYGTNKMLYTVCRTPTIRQKKNEDSWEFFNRCKEWYEEDTELKIAKREIWRSPEEIEEFKAEQDAVINEMSDCKLFYRNESHCMKWGGMCEYAPVCRHYDPNLEYVQFTKNEVKQND